MFLKFPVPKIKKTTKLAGFAVPSYVGVPQRWFVVDENDLPCKNVFLIACIMA